MDEVTPEEWEAAVAAWQDRFLVDKAWSMVWLGSVVLSTCPRCAALTTSRKAHARHEASMQVELLVLEGADSLLPVGPVGVIGR